MKLAIVILLALILLILVRRRLLQIDMSFPLFGALVLLGFASMSTVFIDWIAARLEILDAPRAIILIAIAILLAMVTVLAIAHSRLHHRQSLLLRRMVAMELRQQEMNVAPRNQSVFSGSKKTT
jgi:hypothetical protein